MNPFLFILSSSNLRQKCHQDRALPRGVLRVPFMGASAGVRRFRIPETMRRTLEPEATCPLRQDDISTKEMGRL
jgi:hypothetical protein